MTKVAIKNENITSFGGIYHIMARLFHLKSLGYFSKYHYFIAHQ
ncbi:hypothetical protein ABVC73_02120 [Prevotella melaninogenica]